jgi:hypothetical protein
MKVMLPHLKDLGPRQLSWQGCSHGIDEADVGRPKNFTCKTEVDGLNMSCC